MISIFGLAILFMAASQVYWAWRIAARIRRYVRVPWLRVTLGASLVAVYALMLAYSVGWIGGKHTPIRLTAGSALLGGPFAWWLACSLFAFLVVMIFRAIVFLGARAIPEWAASGRAPGGN